MTRDFTHAEGGQALVIVGIAIAVLVGALAITVDWGYGLATRRAFQTEADAAALSAGRLLVSTFVAGDKPTCGESIITPCSFSATEEDIWTEACRSVRLNAAGSTVAQDRTLGVWFSADQATPVSLWEGFALPSADCTVAATERGPTSVGGQTLYVRVTSSMSYMSFFGIVNRDTFGAGDRRSVQVSASARVRLANAGSNADCGTSRAGCSVAVQLNAVGDNSVGRPGLGLSGASTTPNVAIWPIVLHYDPAAWTAPSLITLIDWDSTSGQADTNSFVSLAHDSPHEALNNDLVSVHQLITESDYTGTASAHHGHPGNRPLPSAPGACSGTAWDTMGSTDLIRAATCDIPNWFYYGYRGSLSVGTSWDQPSWSNFLSSGQPVELPGPLSPTRASCSAPTQYPFFGALSCPNSLRSSRIGDWIEVVKNSSLNRVLLAAEMREFITRYGRTNAATGDVDAVVNVFLWDCGESFDGSSLPPGSAPSDRDRWHLVPSSGADCATVSGNELRLVDRVHLFTVVPLTISLSDIDTVQRRKKVEVFVTARWGDVFGSAGACAAVPTPSTGCGLNPLMNSAFLVPDE